MAQPPGACPSCHTPYIGSDGNVTLGQRPSDGKFTVLCPHCEKPLDDFFMDGGELVSDNRRNRGDGKPWWQFW